MSHQLHGKPPPLVGPPLYPVAEPSSREEKRFRNMRKNQWSEFYVGLGIENEMYEEANRK